MSLLPEAGASFSGNIDGLIRFITIFVVGWFLITIIAMLYGLFTSLKKEGGKAKYITGEQFTHSKWIWIPLVLVTLCDFWIDIETAKVWTLVEVDQKRPAADYDIKVVGRQFYWEFVYPGKDGKLFTDDDVSVAEGNDGTLVLPMGKTVHLHLTSADVLHSFFVRQFRFKQDAIPGRVLTRWVKPTKETGDKPYELFCAEICGPGHGFMRNWIKVVSEDEYKNFLNKLNSGEVAMVTK
jgi:cytochrome c oxidase subunit 2